MTKRAAVVLGLPASGKTTFLAALWHLVSIRELPTRYKFHSLGRGDVTYLNDIADRWRSAHVQERTFTGGNRLVSMNLQDGAGAPFQLTLPDAAGEVFAKMWEDRECPTEVVDWLRAPGVMLLINADTIRAPRWLVEDLALSQALGVQAGPSQDIPWSPSLAPTQVKIVDLLQFLHTPELDIGPRRLAVMISAWDKAVAERVEPEMFVRRKLPLLDQYLRHNPDRWIPRVYGLSAQGGEYDAAGRAGSAEAERLRQLDMPSSRIRVRSGQSDTHDLTEPLAWLLE